MGVYTPMTIEVRFGPDDAAWTDLTPDVLDGVSAAYGIAGVGPLDRVASTGTLTFRLNNSASNSGGLQGYYSPGHANVRTVGGYPFDVGDLIRWYHAVDGSYPARYLFHGRISRIMPTPGLAGPQDVQVECVDWIDDASSQTVSQLAVAVNQRSDEVLSSILDAMDVPPLSRAFQQGDSTFDYALDNVRDEATAALGAIAAVVLSEGGYFYLTGAGVATFNNYRERQTTIRAGAGATLSQTMQALSVQTSRDDIVNAIQVTLHPKSVDAASTTVLWSRNIADGDSPIEIAPGEVNNTIFGPYGDPANGNARCGGVDMVTPSTPTDYLMNRQADGLGADITANLTVSASMTGNGVRWTLTNTGTTPGFITKLQCRGKGVYDRTPFTVYSSNAASILLYGRRLLRYDMPFQQNQHLALAQAGMAMELYSGTEFANHPTSVGFLANASSDLMLAALTIDIGSRVDLYESVTAVGSVVYRRRMYVNACRFDERQRVLTTTWTLAPALSNDVWILDSANLGMGTRPGY